MTVQRLFRVERDPDLFYEDMLMECVIYFENELEEEKRRKLEKLIDSWVYLGLFPALPIEDVGQPLTRETIFFCGGIKYFSGIQFRELAEALTVVSFVVDLGYLDEKWMEILLNCLEGFHQRIARIYLVKLLRPIEI